MNTCLSGLGDTSATETAEAGHSTRRRSSAPRLVALLACLLLAAGVIVETRTAFLQSVIFSHLASALTFDVHPGASSEIHFPSGGPYDKRLGYSELPAYVAAMKAQGFLVTRQASWSPELKRFAEAHGYAVYREKSDAGLVLLDRAEEPLYSEHYPKRIYDDFQAIPSLIVDGLRFIEDRSLLDPSTPRKNPAVDWNRFGFAVAGQIAGKFDTALKQGGASTLATQIEKFRHYAGGQTHSAGDKIGQMLAASTRSYLDGPETLEAQRRIILAYLNSTPLSSRPGYGEVIGLADGLWAWFGTEIAEANAVLAEGGDIASPRKAELFKQALCLLLAQRRPSYYLFEGRKDLAALTERYLSLMADAGVIGQGLRDAARRAELGFRTDPPPPPSVSFVSRKAATSVRKKLLNLLGTPTLYDLDRLDLTASTTFDTRAQKAVAKALSGLGDHEQVKSRGMAGTALLGAEDPSKIAYSVVLYERGSGRNLVRVHADSLNQPFDLNSGAKLILGSTAKLRTLLTYLGIMDRLHSLYEHMPAQELSRESATAKDPLTRWAGAYLAQATDRSLQPMLDAAMTRRYSASPHEAFFTGGGIHVFGNYESTDNARMPTVEEALVHSINLAFIRIMRDIRDYYIAERTQSNEQADNPPLDLRQAYLRRFADQEGSTYLNRFYQEFRTHSPDEVLSLVANQSRHIPNRLAIVYRSARPLAPMSELRDFLGRQLPDARLSDEAIEDLYKTYGSDRYSLNDRAYLAHVHPLKLWLAAYLQDHESATRSQILAASASQRQEAYEWLFKTRSTRGQDSRIRIVTEQDAFEEILQDWRKQGYPFAHLVPSLATAIGSSGDRPDALAELMGIILNDGVRIPTVDIERIDFAGGTPYETQMELAPKTAERVFSQEVARTVRRALTNVVSEGTGARFRSGFKGPNGTPLVVGGKTGTGDNRFKTFGAGHSLVDSQAIDRTATFVFFLEDRFYGTVTAYVAGPEAAKYHFTSALAVQLLKSLTLELQPLIETPRRTEVAALDPQTTLH